MLAKNHKELDVWKKGIDIVDFIYKITAEFPTEERYGLIVQMQRSAVSIPSNIAEGFARQYSKEFKQFLFIALGSSAELDTQVIIAERRDYITENIYNELADLIDHESRMLMSLIKSLK